MVSAPHLRDTTDLCIGFFRDHFAADWTSPIPDLSMSVTEVVAHIAEGCLWYAIDLAAGGADLQPVEHRVKTDGDKGDVLDTLRTHASVLAAVIETTPPSERGFHPMGSADPAGFAAMACDELLIHTDDAARGLGLEFTPPAALVEPVLRRLFPWIDPSDDPWAQLRWANGRIALGGHPRLDRWVWHCAPLADWDGSIPEPSSAVGG